MKFIILVFLFSSKKTDNCIKKGKVETQPDKLKAILIWLYKNTLKISEKTQFIATLFATYCKKINAKH